MKHFSFVLFLVASASSMQAITFAPSDCSVINVSISNSSPQPAGSMVCPQFNSSLGTLQQVTLVPFVAVNLGSASLTIRNDSGVVFSDPSPILQRIAFTITFPGGISQTIIAPLEITPPNFSPLGVGETRTFTATSAFFGLVDTGNPKVATDITPYIGSGTISSVLSPAAMTSVGTPPTGITFLGWNTSFSNFTYTMMYGYEPVPEPSSVVLAGLGLATLPLLSRCRRRQ